MKSDKPLGGKAYGSIPHLIGSRLGPGDHHCEEGQVKIATKQTRDWRDLVIVQEKLDGSNVCVAKLENGDVVAITRAGYIAITSPHSQHHHFDKWVKFNYSRFDELLRPGERLVGEWLMLAHGTIYDLPHEPFVAFDLIDGKQRICYHDFLLRVLPFKVITPKLIHLGSPLSIERMLEKIKISGHGAVDPVEGAVWRVERDGVVDFICKYVRLTKEDGKYFDTEKWNITPQELFK